MIWDERVLKIWKDGQRETYDFGCPRREESYLSIFDEEFGEVLFVSVYTYDRSVEYVDLPSQYPLLAGLLEI